MHLGIFNKHQHSAASKIWIFEKNCDFVEWSAFSTIPLSNLQINGTSAERSEVVFFGIHDIIVLPWL